MVVVADPPLAVRGGDALTLRGLAALCLVTALAPAAAQTPLPTPDRLHHHEATRLSMATVYAIDAWGPDEALVKAAAEAAFDEVDRIDRLMSHYRADSPLSRINREAARHPVAVERELFDFLAVALGYSRASSGAFDVTVGPLMKAWGFFRGEGKVPSEGELAAARQHVGASHVVLDAARGTVAFDEPGVELDLGGIAKGYAIDRAVGILRSRGVMAALVSSGGSTIYGLGSPPGGAGWPVDIQDPLHAGTVARTVRLKNRTLSIAGTSEKFFERGGVRYSHIMDPRTGGPVQGILTVAVLAPTGTAGDALDDALFVLGAEGSRAYLATLPEVEALFFLPDRQHGWRLVRRHGRT